MPSTPAGRKAPRIRRYVLKDGTERVKVYPAQTPGTRGRLAPPTDTVAYVVEAWQRSPMWLAKPGAGGYSASTQRTYAHDVQILLDAAGPHPIAEVTLRDMMDLRDTVFAERGAGAARAFCTVVSVIWKWAVKRGYPAVLNAVLDLTEELPAKGELPPWTLDEVRLALAYLPEHLTRVVWLALWTGQRRADLIGMKWRQFIPGANRILVKQDKTGKELVLPCPPLLREALLRWMPENVNPNEPILLTHFGTPWTDGNVSTTLQRYLSRIEGFPPGRNIHGLRKTMLTMLAASGCTTHENMAISGHSTLKMVEHYTKSADQVRNAVTAIDKLVAMTDESWDEIGRTV